MGNLNSVKSIIWYHKTGDNKSIGDVIGVSENEQCVAPSLAPVDCQLNYNKKGLIPM